jgi:hypothetical protein
VGDLQQDACTVARVRFRPLGASVLEIHQGGDRHVHDVAAAAAVHIGHHGDTTRVMLERGVVEPLTSGRHSHLPFSTKILLVVVDDPN